MRFEPPGPPCPDRLSDEELLGRVPGARIAEAGPLCGLVVERGLGDRALPALESLWRRFAGFGQDRLLPEQVAVVETLAKIGTAAARELLAGIVTAPDLPLPLLPVALRAALAVSLRLPATLTGPLLAHGDPEIREFAIRLCAFGRPEFGGLEACLADTQPGVRRAAAIVLGGFGRDQAKAVLLAELARLPTATWSMPWPPLPTTTLSCISAGVPRGTPNSPDGSLRNWKRCRLRGR